MSGKWLKAALTLFVVAFALSAGILAARLRNNTSPIVEVPQAKHDFGRVKPGQRIRHEFRILNVGSAPLYIHEIQTSCGCTGATLSGNTILPEDEAVLSVWYDLPNHAGDSQQWVMIATNDPNRRQVLFNLSAEAIYSVEIEPRVLNFGLVESGKLPVQRRIVVSQLQPLAAMPQCNVTCDSHRLKIHTKVLDQATMEITVGLPKSAPLGPIIGQLVVEIRPQEQVRIPILGHIVGPVYATPSQLDWRVSYGEAKQMEIAFASLEGPCKVLSVEVPETLRRYTTVSINGETIKVSLKNTSQILSNMPWTGTLHVTVESKAGRYSVAIPTTIMAY